MRFIETDVAGRRGARALKGSLLAATIVIGLWSVGMARAQDVPEPQAPQAAPTPEEKPASPVAPKPRAKERHEKRTVSESKKAEERIKQAQKAEKKPETPAAKGTKDTAPAPPLEPAAPQPAVPQSTGEPIGEFEPVIHARNAKITTCMDKIVSLSARVIDRPHNAVSTYVAAAPNDHVFQSIIGMAYPNKMAPNGAAIVLAAPINASKCEGETVQIYPTGNSCTSVQAALINGGRTLTTLQTLPLLQTKDGNRELLMPTAGGGCVVVSIGLH